MSGSGPHNAGMETEAMTPAPPTIADPRPLFANACALGGQVLAGIGPDQLDLPTPCSHYSVQQLMGHLIDGVRRSTALGRGEDPFGFEPCDAAGVRFSEWPTLWQLTVHDAQQAWADPATLTRSMTLPWATLPGALQLLTYTNELTVHTWDLARATGQQPEWSPEVVAAAFGVMRRALPAAGREAAFQAVIASMPPEQARSASLPFAEAVDVSAEAPLIDQLVAWNGRRP
ncbi:MAG: hypothetical protein JWL70_2220 [Acidimicrobiia bacterium]|nr:hypothetical protein [Acidimicrobiia bacterium]